MMKRMMALLLAAAMLWCGAALADESRDFEWDEWVFRAVWDWKVERRVNGTLARYDIFYDAPLGEENEPKQFWVGYVPKEADFGEAMYFVPCAPEDHFLHLNEDGSFVVMISERTFRLAYEYWLECTTEAETAP